MQVAEYLLDQNGWVLVTSLCLSLRAPFPVQIGFPADFLMLTITLIAAPHCSQVIDWCWCARVFSCPLGNDFFALFPNDAFIVKRCQLLGGWPGHGGRATMAGPRWPHKYR